MKTVLRLILIALDVRCPPMFYNGFGLNLNNLSLFGYFAWLLYWLTQGWIF